MKRLRSVLFGGLGIAIVLLTAAVERGGGAGGANSLLVMLAMGVTGVFVAAVVIDTFWHALKGQGQACRRCGHLRRMSSFTMYGGCPNCGE